jgi:CheY-like chemotaxis protein
MSSTSKHRILVVDDEPSVRGSFAGLLNDEGYEVSTAEHGFDALLQLRRDPSPDIIISDLNMPQMSGFEFLSVVRRRFPGIPVVAVSGAYESRDDVPGGVIADAFYAKGQHLGELLRTVAELIRTAPAQAMNHHRQSAPVWIPRNGKDSKGVPYIVLTCTECLRSFPLSVLREDVQEIQETPCLFCAVPVRYIIDFSLAVASPAHTANSKKRAQAHSCGAVQTHVSHGAASA